MNVERVMELLLAMQKKMDTNQAKMKSVAEHGEVPKEEAAVKTFRALKKRHGDQNVALGRCQKPKKQTQGNGGSQKKLVAACRGMTCHAGVAWHKGHSHKGPTVEQRLWKDQTRECCNWNLKRMDVREGTSGATGNHHWNDEPRLKRVIMSGSRTTLGRIFRKTVELEVAKQIAGISIRLRKISDWTLWRSQPPPK
jgi:hypothetical protein